MSQDVLEHSRAKIDAEILVLQERIRSLRTDRNTLSPLHGLPPEVMSQIFMWVQLRYRGNCERGVTYTGSLPRWIGVTQICRHWRNIALNSKSLYSTILVHNLRYSQEIFNLSGSAALSIIDSVDYRTESLWRDPKLQELVLAALPRVRNLWLTQRAQDFLLPHFEKSDLVLEELSLARWNNLAPTMFPKSLRYLQLYCCAQQFYNCLPRLSNLVELSLTSDSTNQNIPIDVLLKALDGMPRLISLELSAMLSAAEHTRVSRITPKLQSITLYDNPDRVAEFLPWLVFAPRFTIDLSVKSTRAYNEPELTMDWLPSLAEQLGQHLHPSAMALRTAKFSWGGESYYNKEAILTLSEGAGEPDFRLRVLLKDKEQAHCWLKSIEALPLHDIESVTVEAPFDVAEWSDGPWKGIRALRQLSLPKADTSMAFLQYLIAHEPSKGGPSDVFSPLFASLEELSLDGVQYGRDLKSKVQAVFNARMKKSGVKFRKLTFNSSTISPDSIKQLSKAVEVVEQLGEKKAGKKKHRYGGV